MDDAKYITATEQNFKNEILGSDVPVLVDFWADWCGPCKMIAPFVEELATEFDGKAKVAKVNVDDQPALAGEYGVRSIPTLLFIHNGQVVEQMIGATTKAVLTEKLNTLVG